MRARYGKPAGAVLLLVLLGCGGRDRAAGRDTARVSSSPEAQARVSQPDSRPAIVFLGTSLTAGYGLPDPSLAFPALIQAKLDSAGRRFRVVNAGISGESSAGALSRIDLLLTRETVAVLVVETGANDGLRGQEPDSVRARIQAIFDRARLANHSPRLVLAGMEAPPNLGESYTSRFRALFPSVARANGAELIPFLLAGVAGVDSLNQEDRIHPTAAGAKVVAENVWTVLERVTREPWR
ncbi:MAG TPA: arylesterase [Gemmatimonadales bacterium]|jgi:acyl-CoA thioesterase-1|nr:arylesterase [Gemmatimonadales bacterium]